MAATIRIWGRLNSLNVRKVVWAAQELGLAFERTDAGAAFGLNQTPDYLRKNPNGLVPLLEDGEFALWESNVIVRYLCAQYSANRLYPIGLQQRFDAERWMDWQQTTFNPAGRDAFIQLVRTPPTERSPEAVRRSVAATEPLLARLDAHLAKQAFMGGSAFGMADMPLGCEIHRWWGVPTEPLAACGVTRQPMEAFSHLQRWYLQLLARPAARGVLDVALT